MKRPTDSYKDTHNLTLSTEDTLFGGQVAELMAVMAKNPDLSYCKIVEVLVETTAPLTPSEELLKKIPSQRPYISSPKKPEAAAVNDPVPSEPVLTTAIEYNQNRYEDLKPPSSPSPSQPSFTKDLKVTDTVPEQQPSPSDTSSSTQEIDSIPQAKKREFLSPYAAYEDLKLPTSPCPTAPSTSKKTLLLNLKALSKTPTFFHSPYHVYDDLKPPTSPSPRAPNASSPSISAVNSSVPQIESVSSNNGPPQIPEDDEQHLP
ncbi:hypothetical protein PIB30_013151 [Stylosanthes scabra]|uniref:Uncharacterized protein n=1 Tax=Stylosanthes scabra TaxID=79078 RepID=A0ABU6Y4F6_9FABA|nr:hypothetical protein [Stylosanthes scabra]